MPEEKELTSEELESAWKIHNRVASYLKLRYMWIVILLAIISPIVGLILGAVVENKLFSNARTELLTKATESIETQVKAAADNANQAKSYLEEIKATKIAFDTVLELSSDGSLVKFTENAAAVDKTIADLKTKMEAWEKAIKNDFPDGFASLKNSEQDLELFRKNMEKLNLLFRQNKAAAALTGQFYRIDELSGLLTLELYVNDNMGSKLPKILEAAKTINAQVTLYDSSSPANDLTKLDWPLNAPVKCEIFDIADVKTLGSSPGKPADKGLRFTFDLNDNEKWWRLLKTDSELKDVNLLSFSKFDSIEIKLQFPFENDSAAEYLKECKQAGRIYPKAMKLNATANRVKINLAEISTPKSRPSGACTYSKGSPQVKKTATVAAAAPVPSVVTLQFTTSFFEKASTIYTEELAKRGHQMQKETTTQDKK